MNRKLRAAIVGCGDVGGGYDPPPPIEWSMTHAGGYYLCPDTELVAAADTDETQLGLFGKKWRVEHLYPDYRQLLQEEPVDILSICVPTDFHYQVFRDALGHDIRAFFVEKPLCYELEEGRQLLELSRGKVVAVNYFRRWNPSFDSLRRDIASGKYGRIARVSVLYRKELLHNASHGIDLLRYLIGEPMSAMCLTRVPAGAKDHPVDFYLSFVGGIQAFFQNVACDYNIFDIDFLTDRARILVTQHGQQLVRFRMIQDPFYRTFDVVVPDGRVEETGWRDCPTRAIEDIVGCVRHGGRPACSLEDGLRDLEISRAVLESGRNGVPMPLSDHVLDV